MATATHQTAHDSALIVQLETLQTQAKAEFEQYQALIHQANIKFNERRTILSRMAELATEAASQNFPNFEAMSPVASHPVASYSTLTPSNPLLKKKPKAVQSESVGKRKPGRPKGSVASPAKIAVENSKNKSSKKTSLKDVVEGILSKHSDGLKISQIKDIVEKSATWKSTSANIGPMIQNAIQTLKTLSKVVRTEEGCYKLVA